jgi:hypothetical protein
VNNNWKLVTSWHSSDPKKLMKYVTLPNSQTFAASNRYSILATLKETDRSGNKSNKPTEHDTFNVTNNIPV